MYKNFYTQLTDEELKAKYVNLRCCRDEFKELSDRHDCFEGTADGKARWRHIELTKSEIEEEGRQRKCIDGALEAQTATLLRNGDVSVLLKGWQIELGQAHRDGSLRIRVCRPPVLVDNQEYFADVMFLESSDHQIQVLTPSG